jgi:membrane associated rhomboid family serine protease
MQAAPLADVPRYPAIAGTCLIALGLFAVATPTQVEPLTLDLRAFWAEPWRLLTSALLHAGQLQSEEMVGGLVHVGFNSFWLWRLGTPVERELGHLATLALVVVFALAGSLLEYAFTGPAVGLSGVVYGFVGLLWMIARRRPSARPVLDRRTAQFFGFWFGFCVLATVTGAMPIANFAHAGGAIAGGLIGWAMTRKGREQTPSNTASSVLAPIVVGLACLAVFAAAATIARPWLNLSKRAGLDAMALAERSMTAGEVDEAIAWAERGVGYWRTPADHWAYLSWLYFAAERPADARDALLEATRRDPDNAAYREILAQFEALAAPPSH